MFDSVSSTKGCLDAENVDSMDLQIEQNVFNIDDDLEDNSFNNEQNNSKR